MAELYAPNMVRAYLLPLRTLDMSGGGSQLVPIFFQTMPAVSGDGKTASYSGSETPMGRAEPFQIYSGSGARSFSIQTSYVAISDRFETRWVANQINRLMALCYPIYSRERPSELGVMNPPPMCLLNVGDRYINLPVVVTSVSTDYPAEGAYDPETLLPIVAQVTISVTVSYPYGQVPGHDDIAAKYLGDNTTEAAGSGDAIFPSMTKQDFSLWSQEVPNIYAPSNMSPEDSQALTSRTISSNRRQSYVVSRPLGDVQFGDQSERLDAGGMSFDQMAALGSGELNFEDYLSIEEQQRLDAGDMSFDQMKELISRAALEWGRLNNV